MSCSVCSGCSSHMGKVAAYGACCVMSNTKVENDGISTSASPIYHHVVQEGVLTSYHYFIDCLDSL